MMVLKEVESEKEQIPRNTLFFVIGGEIDLIEHGVGR